MVGIAERIKYQKPFWSVPFSQESKSTRVEQQESVRFWNALSSQRVNELLKMLKKDIS